MQAIEVRYIGPSNTKGTRYKATCAAGSITVGANYQMNLEENMNRVALMLVEKLEWTGDDYGSLASGTLKNGNQVYVLVNKSSKVGA